MPAKDILHDSVKTALLVLAVPNEVFQTLFQRKTIQRVLERYQVNLIVVDPEQERVVL
ncbi:XisH family protein [Chloroflexi bacterium TSY]|nr:XisH family protein [Chloroflexi bacterium TSY]